MTRVQPRATPSQVHTPARRRPRGGIRAGWWVGIAVMLAAGLAERNAVVHPAAVAAALPQEAAAVPTAELSGTITDLASGHPLAGARARAGGRVVLTGPDGRFSLTLPVAIYQVQIDAEGYGGATAIDQRVGDGGLFLDLGLPPYDPDPLASRAIVLHLQAADGAAADGLAAPTRALDVAPLSPAEQERGASEAPGSETASGSTPAPEAGPVVSQALSAATLADRPLAAVPSMIRVWMPDGQIVAMDTDTYLKGVVPAEMGYVFRRGFEALKAQAVASRSYAATSCLPESAGDPERCEPGLDANVDTTTRTQVWRPVHYDIADAAVDATSDQVATSAGVIVPTLYFARAVGRTTDSEASPCCGGRAWPQLRSVASPDPFAQARGHGAGMSQEGAAVLADWGTTFDEIIGYYYRGTEVAPMPASPLDGPVPAPRNASLPAPPPDGPLPSTDQAGDASPEVPAAAPAVAAPAPAAPPVRSGEATLDPSEWPAVSVNAVALAEMLPEDRIDRGPPFARPDLIPPDDQPTTPPTVIEGDVVRADFPFMALGARWTGAVPPGGEVHLAVRTSRDGLSWSDWTPLLDAESDARQDGAGSASMAYSATGETATGGTAAGEVADGGAIGREAGDAPASGEAAGDDVQDRWSRLLIARGRYVQPRLILESAGPTELPDIERLDLHYFNSDAGPTAPNGTLSIQSTADAAGPPIVSRAAWGADERKRFDTGGREIWPPVYTEPRAQIIHHTVTTNDPADPAAVVRAIYQYHAVTQGWGDIGYNFLVDHRGNIYEGRFGGERSGRIVQGGHALQYNANTIGAALLGTFTGAGDRPSAAAETALVELLASRGVRYAIDPVAPVTLAGTRFSHRVMGHRDALPGHTVCPGDGGYSRVPAIRNAVAVRMGELGAAPTPTRTALPPTPTPVSPTATRVPPTPTPWPPAPSATPLPGTCANLVADGDFERENALWRRNRAYYTRWDAYRGQVALFVGLRGDDPDQGQTFASAAQTIRLPAAPGRLRLAFAARTQGDGADARVVRVLDAAGAPIAIGRIDLPATSGWQTYSYDLTTALAGRAGQDIQLYFGVINNGDGQRSYVRLDDVVLEHCPPGAPTSTPSPVPPVALTPDCRDVLAGGDFEAEAIPGWSLSGDHPAVRIADPVHAGAGALRLGLVDPASDGFGYAAASRPFTLPVDAVTATLSLWLRAPAHSPEDAFVVELRRPVDGTRQILVGPAIDAQTETWLRREVRLPAWAAGSELELYLAVLNRGQAGAGGGVTAVAVDDVALEICRYPGRAVLPWAGALRPATAAYP